MKFLPSSAVAKFSASFPGSSMAPYSSAAERVSVSAEGNKFTPLLVSKGSFQERGLGSPDPCALSTCTEGTVNNCSQGGKKGNGHDFSFSITAWSLPGSWVPVIAEHSEKSYFCVLIGPQPSSSASCTDTLQTPCSATLTLLPGGS